MVFAKDFLNANTMSSSKLKNIVAKTPVLSPIESIRRCTQLIVTTGNGSLPVVEDSKLIGIISESDVIPQTHFGNTLVDNVMIDAQRNFAERMNATTISLNSSHASLVTHPDEIAELILNATKAVTK